jgi:hypothetical protein
MFSIQKRLVVRLGFAAAIAGAFLGWAVPNAQAGNNCAHADHYHSLTGEAWFYEEHWTYFNEHHHLYQVVDLVSTEPYTWEVWTCAN